MFLLLLTPAASTGLQHSPNHVQRLFSISVHIWDQMVIFFSTYQSKGQPRCSLPPPIPTLSPRKKEVESSRAVEWLVMSSLVLARARSLLPGQKSVHERKRGQCRILLLLFLSRPLLSYSASAKLHLPTRSADTGCAEYPQLPPRSKWSESGAPSPRGGRKRASYPSAVLL